MTKFRLGFVSNSSSSSFIVCGNEIPTLPEKYDSKLYAEGDAGIEGCDFFNLSKTMYNYLVKNPVVQKKFQFYIVENEDCGGLNTNDLPANCHLYPLEVDYNITANLEELKEKYGE